MKLYHSSKKSILLTGFAVTAITIFSMFSCTKDTPGNEVKNPNHYDSKVIDKWMTVQLRLMRNATGIPNHGFSRHFAYSGVAAVLSIDFGTGQLSKWSAKLNGISGLPAKKYSHEYFYPANVNASLAAINRAMFPNASAADKAAIDSLETALKNEFLQSQSPEIIANSESYGKAVSAAVYGWAESDGYKNANNPFTLKTGPGKWIPTPPAFANPATPHWGKNRTIIKGSIRNTKPVEPPYYSDQPNSDFYKMVKQVRDVSQTLTQDQKDQANFWKDIPGVSSPGHWLSILQQVMKHRSTGLGDAALAYALTGAAINDALITCFITKYDIQLVRPVSYIRNEMGMKDWSPFLSTPAHPEFPSAHSSLSLAAGSVMEKLFGTNKALTDHTYDYLGYPARTYPTYTAIGVEAGKSRLYGGIHYQFSIDAGSWQGMRVAENIFSK